MTVRDIIVEVYCLTRILLHETFIYNGPVLGGNVEPRPAYPGKTHGLLSAGEGGDQSSR